MKTVFIIVRGTAFLLIFLVTCYTNAQVKNSTNKPVRRITLEVEDMALEDLLELLQKDMDIPVAYAIDNIPADISITIHVDDVSISEFFELVCRQARLTCEFVNGYYILKYGNQPEPIVIIHEEKIGGQDSIIYVNSAYGDENPDNRGDLINRNSDILSGYGFLANKKLSNNGISFQYGRPVKKIKVPAVPNYTTKEKKNARNEGAALSVFYSIDLHNFHFKPGLTTEQYYQSEWNYSLGISGNFALTSRNLRMAGGILLSHKNFRYLYNYRVLDIDDPIPIPDVTTVELSYLEIPAGISYRFIGWREFSAALTVGYNAAILIDERETTRYQNTETRETDIYLSATRSYQNSAFFGLILSCPINKKWKVEIEPQFIHYFHPVNSQAMEISTELLRIKAGIAFSL